MTLAGTYTVYGNVYNEDGTAESGATVTIKDVSNFQGYETVTTNAAGYYQINIQDIASDDDDILVEVELNGGYRYGECFTLDLYEAPKNIDLTVDAFDFLRLYSDTYEINIRFCPISDIDRSINKNVDVLNFWTDDISAVVRDLDDEPLNIGGVEYAEEEKNICYIARKFEVIWNIMDSNEEIHVELGTVSTASTASTAEIDCFDGIYVIKNFNFKTIKKIPNAYTWQIQLERVRDA